MKTETNSQPGFCSPELLYHTLLRLPITFNISPQTWTGDAFRTPNEKREPGSPVFSTGYVWRMDLNEMKVEQLNQTFPGSGAFGSVPPSAMLYPSYDNEYFFYHDWMDQSYEFYSKDGALLNSLPHGFSGSYESTRIFGHPNRSIGLMKYIFERSQTSWKSSTHEQVKLLLQLVTQAKELEYQTVRIMKEPQSQ